MLSDGVDEELGGGSVAPSPARFELQEDPAFWKDNNVQVGFPPSLCELSPPLLRWRAFYSISGTATVLRSNSAGSSGRLCVRGHLGEYLSVVAY
jgi:hypothetical protein